MSYINHSLCDSLLAQTLVIPAMKLLGVQDTVILIFLGSISMVSRIVDCIAKEGWMFYAGTIYRL